jgi:prolyl 4-hydroxylase
LIQKATPRLHRSGVVAEGGGSQISDIRTSNGMFFNREEDNIIANVERKLSEWALIPLGQGEGIQLLRYEKDQEYRPHFDYFFHKEGRINGGNRLATILMYLSDVEAGGETIFPKVKPPSWQTTEAGYSECAMKGLAVRPRKGDAVLFWSLRTDGTLDRGSEHGSCPVIRGVKYAATKWFHVAHYAMNGERAVQVDHVVHRPSPPPAPPGCTDSHENCAGWAEGGECESNPGFMIGTKEQPGACLLSCGRCDLMISSPIPLQIARI